MLTKFSFVICALALLLLWLVPSSVYTFAFGPGFHDVKHSVRFLFPGILIYSLPIVISSFYLGTANYKPLIISNLTGAVSVVVFSMLLIPPYVMSGAALAATLSFAITAFLLFVYFMMDNNISIKQFFISRNDNGFFVGYMRGWLKGLTQRNALK
jgi:O-antigen/teichoic acid export membrane protein